MEQIDRITALAHRAAQLVPEPPVNGDAMDYLEWQELVWQTAMRLGRLAGPELVDAFQFESLRAEDAPVTGDYLLGLGALAWREQPTHDYIVPVPVRDRGELR